MIDWFRKKIKKSKAKVVVVNDNQAYVIIYIGKKPYYLWNNMSMTSRSDYSSCTHTKVEAENLCKAYNLIHWGVEK